ncbi:MAG: Ppx/GppA family phosphatase [Ferrovibrio sp.]|jgi:exopolyphosphatase/guanosine-5'-triphosphate,3'-diphosphate pyrophosphatase|nr:Ppx/GppA family phosphatase [Ferrovibrio sp.]
MLAGLSRYNHSVDKSSNRNSAPGVFAGGARQEAGAGTAPRSAPVYAALDLGTNNCRLLIARPNRDNFRVVEAFSRIVRLGEGLAATGRLSDAAMARTIAALKICSEKMARRGVTIARAVATEACRRAENGIEFMHEVKAVTGIHFDIISTAEEARLALAGCAPLLEPSHNQAVVFDIGGGSTEVMWARVGPRRRTEVLDWISLPFGVVNLTERWGAGDTESGSYIGMINEVAAKLEPFEARHNLGPAMRAGKVQVLGTSGTVTTLAGVLLGLPRYERRLVDGCWLEFPAVIDQSQKLAAMSVPDRAKHGCIGEERADLVVAGCAILEALHRFWPAPRLRVADRGVREGVLLELMRQQRGGA